MTIKKYSIILWLLCIISSFAVFPFAQRAILLSGGTPVEMTYYIAMLGILEVAALYGLLVWWGMQFSQKIGIRFLLLEEHPDLAKDLFKPGFIAAAAVVTLIVMVDKLLPAAALNVWYLATNMNPLYGFMGSFAGGINEEVITRLFILSGIALLFMKLCKQTSKYVIMWVSIVVAALLFGLGHIPQFVHAITPDMPLLVFRILLLNAIGGITFGWLFWRKAFETAMLAHFLSDIGLYVVIPIIYALM